MVELPVVRNTTLAAPVIAHAATAAGSVGGWSDPNRGRDWRRPGRRLPISSTARRAPGPVSRVLPVRLTGVVISGLAMRTGGNEGSDPIFCRDYGGA
jgi:hypothetical protein